MPCQLQDSYASNSENFLTQMIIHASFEVKSYLKGIMYLHKK